MVLLHGFTGSPRSFDALRLRLAGPVVVPELVGHGASAPNVDSFEGEVDRLAALIAAQCGRDPQMVVGYSMGGRLALGLLARHPRAIDAVVAIGAHPGQSDALAKAARRRADDELSERIERTDLSEFVSEWGSRPLFESQRVLSPDILAAQRSIRLSHDKKELARSLRVVGLGRMPDLGPTLRHTSQKLHLVTGAFDHRFTNLAAELRPASHTIVAGAGHNVLLERPDAVADVIATVKTLTTGRRDPSRAEVRT